MISSSYQRYLLPSTRFDDIERDHAILQARERPDRCFFLEGEAGSVSLELLDWDSQVLGTPTARINAFFSSRSHWNRPELDKLVVEAEQELAQRRVRFASCRVGFENLDLADSLSASGWRIRDVMNIYNAPRVRHYIERSVDEEVSDICMEQIKEYTGEFSDAFRLSRIHADSRISPSLAAHFHQNLFARISEGDPAYTGICIRSMGQIAGIAVGSQDTGLASRLGRKIAYLWLIVIFERFRGSGLSTPLLAAFIDRLQGTDLIEVGTQVNNFSANHLYSKAGLRLVANAITFHKWFD